LSYKQAQIKGEPTKFNRIQMGLEYLGAMYLESTNYSDAGQYFTSIGHPWAEWQLTARSKVGADYYFKKYNGTGANDPGITSYGRPGVSYSYDLPLTRNLKTGTTLAIRLPYYDGQNLDPKGLFRVWKISLQSSWDWKVSGSNAWFLLGGIDYNSDKNWTSPSTGQGFIWQRPVIGILSAGHRWSGYKWNFGVGLRTEQSLSTGRTIALNQVPQDNSLYQVATNNLVIDGNYKLSGSTSLVFRITKSIIESAYSPAYLTTEFDDPSYGSNLSLGAGLTFDL
jgi:hypothetical protein